MIPQDSGSDIVKPLKTSQTSLGTDSLPNQAPHLHVENSRFVVSDVRLPYLSMYVVDAATNQHE